jgi:hypothetical protein
VCVESVRNNGVLEVDLQWQTPLHAIKGLELKSMPLVLTIEVDQAYMSNKGLADEKEALSGVGGAVRREGSVVMRDKEEKIVSRRLFGDWQRDHVALTRLYNLLNCVLGRFDV